MSMSKDFQELLAHELRRAGAICNDAMGRQIVCAIAEKVLFAVDQEAPEHVRVVINRFNGGVVNLGYEPLTVYGCDILDELLPNEWEKTDTQRQRLLAKLKIVGQTGSTIH